MHRIDTKTAQKDKFGAGKNGFTRGNPQTGTPATDLDDDYFDMLQEELCSVVEASGASLEKAQHDQLLTALRALLLSRKNPFGDIKSDGTVKTALENLGLGEAAKRDIGTGANQIPDMSLFASINTVTAAAQKFPSGLVLQCGQLNGAPNVSSTYGMKFPMTFSRVIAVVVTLNVTGAAGQPTVSATNVQNTGFDITVSPGSGYGASADAYYIAMGY
ncbi:unknown [Enterobacteria phage SfV]|uniref:short tail fiber protein n=1 Tax=Shigella phage SfV TaxID=55884 RepID=UPI000009BBF6|nr:short tail fiber protein [Enterobacteria phage SfV]AAB72130.2 unknown [Enterobacteria phage SfV]